MRPIATDEVAWSVGASVLFVTIVSPAKNGWTDRDAVWVGDSGVTKEQCISWGFRSSAMCYGMSVYLFYSRVLFRNRWMHRQTFSKIS